MDGGCGCGCGECTAAKPKPKPVFKLSGVCRLRLEYSRGGRAVCYAVVRKGAAVGKKKQRQFQEASNEATAESVQTERLFAWQLS